MNTLLTRFREMRLQAGLIFGVAFLSACASQSEKETFASLTQDMLGKGMDYVGELYVTEPDIPELTLTGLNGLSEIDKSIAARLTADGSLLLTSRGAIIDEEKIDPNADARDWGEAAAHAITDARSHSDALRQASAEDIYLAYFTPLIAKLDRYSRYHSAAETADIRARREGFGGIGVSLSFDNGKVLIMNVRHYTPAERAGLKSGDSILEIDGTETENLPQRDVINRLRGPIDSKVELLVQHGIDTPTRLSIRRVLLVPETVTYHREGDAAYIKILSFNRNTAEGLTQALADAHNEIGKKRITGYILDLRGNPGGLVDQSVATANLFLKEGQIVSTQGRHPDSRQSFEATDNDATKGKPILVLVDGNSASAAEIVSAALQDNGRAIIIGSNTYGKGTVQAIERMPNGGELDITWARYHAPSGYSLHGLGVLPNLCTSNGNTADEILSKLRMHQMKRVPIARRNSVSPDDQNGLDQLRGICPARHSEDPIDMELAKKLLQEPNLLPEALKLGTPFKPAS